MTLLRWARSLMRLLLPFHLSHRSLPLSAAPCLGKTRVSCARWRVLRLLWGGGGRGPGTANGPINVTSDVDTDDDSGSFESEPHGTFAVGSTRDSPGRGQTGAAKFIGREFCAVFLVLCLCKHSFMAGLVHFPYFRPPKWEKQWLRWYAVGAQNSAFLLLRTPTLRVVAPPHIPWLGTTPPLRLPMQQRG